MIKEDIKEDIPVYYFSKIKDYELRKLVNIKQQFSNNIFDNWFNNPIIIKDSEIKFLTELLNKEFHFIRIYKEEDLKVKFIAPILNKIDFRDINKEIRDFYIVSRDKSSASDNFPPSILSATESFGNLCAKFKDILNQELETIVIESNDGTLFITTLRSILLVILCTTKARIGKIKMLIQRILLGESTKKTKDKDVNQK